MSRIDWNNDSLTVRTVLEGFMEGIDEEKYAYTLDVESNPLEYVLYKIIKDQSLKGVNIINLMTLDEYGIVGNNLLKLWYMCKEDDEYFKKTVSYITGTALDKCFDKEEVIKNMDLEDPISFIPNDESVINFDDLSKMRRQIGDEKVDEIIYVLRSNLVREYNKYVNFNNLKNELLEEPMRPKLEKTDLPDDYLVDIKELYFDLNTDMNDGLGPKMGSK